MVGPLSNPEVTTSPQRKPFRFEADFMSQPSMVCSGEVWLPSVQRPINGYPLALVVPGYFADHTSDLSIAISTHLASNGIVSVATDWDRETYVDPIGNKNTLETLFEDGIEHNQLRLERYIDKSSIILIGVSYGGTVAILSRLAEKVRGIIALSPVLDPTNVIQRSHFKKFSQRVDGTNDIILGARKVQVPEGAFRFGGRTHQLNRSSTDMEKWLLESYRETRCPVVLINASEGEDDIVPLAEVEQIHSALPTSKLVTFSKPEGYSPSDLHNFKLNLREPLLKTLSNEIEMMLR